MRRTIAVDFDGTLCRAAWPNIGAPRWEIINAVKREAAQGSAIILWTCRTGALLHNAVLAAMSWGIRFDAVNANLPEHIAAFRGDSRKIYADEYWDDQAVRIPK